MPNFFAELPIEMATEMQQLGRLVYELRENRAHLLSLYSVASETELLDGIRERRIAEHPAYEHYLGARILAESHAAVRAQLRQMVAPGKPE